MRTTIAALLAISIGLAACASQPNANLEQARNNFATLQAHPKAGEAAALETKKAGEMLDRAEKAYREDADKALVDHLAYLANQSIKVAEHTIDLHTAEQKLGDVSAQRNQARLEAREQQIKELQSSLNAKQTERGTLVTFGNLLFDLNRATLKPTAMGNIGKLADFLKQNEDRQVIIEGYTDSSGSDAYNLRLSEQRANSVRDALIRMGVSADRIVARGYGEQYPISSNDSPAGRAMNRRVDVTISNDDQPVAPRSAASAS